MRILIVPALNLQYLEQRTGIQGILVKRILTNAKDSRCRENDVCVGCITKHKY